MEVLSGDGHVESSWPRFWFHSSGEKYGWEGEDKIVRIACMLSRLTTGETVYLRAWEL